MPEIPPNIQQFIAAIPPADRAGFYDWLKAQKSPGQEEEPDAGADGSVGVAERPAVEWLSRINEILGGATEPNVSVNIEEQELHDYLKALPFPDIVEVAGIEIYWDKHSYGIYVYTFSLFPHAVKGFYMLNPVKPNRGGAFKVSGGEDTQLRQELNNFMKNLPGEIGKSLQPQIEPGWEMAGMHVTEDGKLYFDFKKREPEAKAEPPATGLPPDRDAPTTPPTREEQLETRRQEIARNLAIVAANMEELDDFELVDPGEYSINARSQPSADLYMRLRDQMGRLGSQVSISDGRLMLGNADKATSQMLAEINRRRAVRGEPPAETVFDQQQAATEITPLTSLIESVDMVEFSTSLANVIEDLPRVLTSIDTNNPMWGRVNALRHDNITFGKANESAMAATDDLRKRILTTRRIYQDKRYVGSWEQEIEYSRSRIEAVANNPKTLGSYRESLFGEDRKPIEEVRVGFDNRGRVYDVDNIHYADGEKIGITRLHFGYDSDGDITQTIKIELDSSGNNELSRKEIKPAPTPEQLSAAEAAIGDLLPRGMTLEQALEYLAKLAEEEKGK